MVNAATGAPVGRALVSLAGAKQSHQLTDGDGRFRFENVPRGNYNIGVQKPGFFAGEYFRLGYPERRNITLEGESLSTRLKLYPEAVVFGRVTNDAGAAVEGIRVELRRARKTGGRERNSPAGEGITNDEGEFRIAGVRPGAYLVQTAEAGSRRRAYTVEMDPLGGSGVKASYFAPGVTDSAMAAIVHVGMGQGVPVNIQLTKEPGYRVSGTISGMKEGERLGVVLLQQGGNSAVGNSNLPPGQSGFRFDGIPPGKYYVLAIGGSLSTLESLDEIRIGYRELEIQGDLDGVVLGVSGIKKMPFTYRIEGKEGNAESRGVPISIQFELQGDAEIGEEKATRLENEPGESGEPSFFFPIIAGTFRAMIPNVPSYYLESLRAGSVDLLAEDLVLAPNANPEPVQAVFRSDGGQIQGEVRLEDGHDSGTVFVIPEEAPRLGFQMPLDEAGKFTATMLRPGKYVVIALEDGEDLDATDEGTLQELRPKGTSVDVEAKSTAHVELSLLRLQP